MKLVKQCTILFFTTLLLHSCSSNDESSNSVNSFKNDNCETKWTQEMIDRAIDACVKTDNSVADCTCAVENTAKELSICETLTKEGIAKQVKISLNCGIQPKID